VRRAAIYRWDSERQVLLATQEYGFSENEESLLTAREFATGVFPVLDVSRQENRIVTHPLGADVRPASWTECQPQVWNEADAMNADRLLIAMPLSIKNDMFGVLLLEEAENGRRFRSRRLEIIRGIAQQAALAIQNDLFQQDMVIRERLETEAQLARQIQQTFIPHRLPLYEGWQLAASWRTARQVGGDFYDVIELPNGKLGLFIADVADKGMPAALFMALTRTLVRAAVLQIDSPAEALRRVNDQLLPDTQQGMFVTAIYGVLDMQQGAFTFVNAGHNPPFRVKQDGSVEKLSRTAVALGVMEQPGMRERTIFLEQDDILLLYTDGVTECFSPQGEQFGEGRLREILISKKDHALNEILSSLEAALNEFSDPLPPSDDLTILAIKKTTLNG
jgi:serine phosphatase RsbU (regulator of sigma subunit)